MKPVEQDVVSYGQWTFDRARRLLTVNGSVVPLQRGTLDLFECLLDHEGRVLSKDALIEKVWGGRVVTDAAMYNRVNKLRAALQDDEGPERCIQWEYGTGLRFLRPNRRAQKSEGEPTSKPFQPALCGAPDPSTCGDHAEPREEAPHLIIMPVETSDARPEIRELAEALTGEFANWLGGTFWMTAETAPTPRDGVYVLTSMLRASGERLRFEVWLRGPGGARIWATKEDGFLSHSFDWQDRVSEAVVGHVSGQIQGDLLRRLASIDPKEATAEQLMFKGALSVDTSLEGWLASLELIELAALRDPRWVLPRAFGAGLAFAGSVAGGTDRFDRWVQQAHRWIGDVSELAPDEAKLGPVGAMLRLAGGGSEAEVTIATARALLRRLPFDQDALFWGSWALLYAGDPEPALVALKRAQRVVQLSFYEPFVVLGVAHASIQLGDDETAVHYATEATRLQPNYAPAWRVLAGAQALRGNMKAAREAAERLLGIMPGDTVSAAWARARYPETPGLERYRDGLLQAGIAE